MAKGKKSTARWKHIKSFHIIEPADFQLYMAKHLFVPHYQVSPSEMKEFFFSNIMKEYQKSPDTKIIFYPKEERFTRNSFLCVVNCPDQVEGLDELNEFLDVDNWNRIINKYAEKNKEDAGRGNIYFDRGRSSSQCLVRDKKFYGLAIPAMRKIKPDMIEDDILFCNTAETMLSQIFKKVLPIGFDGNPDDIYCTPNTVKELLPNRNVSNIHAVRMT